MNSDKLECRQCKWQGNTNEVKWDTVETCMGTDKIEICPKCGSMEVYQVNTGTLNRTKQNKH